MRTEYRITPCLIGRDPFYKVEKVQIREKWYALGASWPEFLGFAPTQAEADKMVAHCKQPVRSVPE